MTLSVCTIGFGRADHLKNLIAGLSEQTQPPLELVIAVMQSDRYDVPATNFPVRQISMSAAGLPLAAARNAAACAAHGDGLAFLDIDCIPEPKFVSDYAAGLAEVDALLMGEVMYLPQGATDRGVDFEAFGSCALNHSERAGPPEDSLGECSDYRCFWSLNFAIRAGSFARVGGFDERYVGYGGEDTDFGRTVVQLGLPIYWRRGAKAYHQYHPHHMPPVHHIDAVIQNSMIFAEKWGHLTMEHWLRCFELMGLVDMTSGHPRRIRDVTEADLALTRQRSDAPYASAADVMEVLERRPQIASR